MILLPAIDIIDGRAVRLERGDFALQTLYHEDPSEAAKHWVKAGARALHVVDLDGARAGRPHNLEHVRRIVEGVNVPVQVGGGLRSLDAIEAVLEAGVSNVILGTAALRDPTLLSGALAAHAERVVVSLDARGGKVAAAGWTEQTDVTVADALDHLQRLGVRRFVYSSIERDGMMSGPDVAGAKAFSAGLDGEFTYSGGVSALADLEALASLRLPNMTGVISGKAIYEGRLDVAEGQALLDAFA